MSRRNDPAWIRAAETLFAACLWLFPKALREAHGEEMRQAFRDRCREVARGERSAFRVLALELFPDTLRSAGAEQLSATFDDMRPRQYWALGLLCCAALGLLFHDSLSPPMLDLAFRAKYGWLNLQTGLELSQQERKVRLVANELRRVGTPESNALGAYLYRSTYSGRSLAFFYGGESVQRNLGGLLVADGERATAAVADVMGSHPSAFALAVATQACLPAVGCDRGRAVRQLVQQEPENGFGWSQAFSLAAEHQSTDAMRQAARGMAESSYYDDYQGRIAARLITTARELAPDDAPLQAAIARQIRDAIRSESYRGDIRLQCTPRRRPDLTPVPHWVELTPGAEADCLRIAKLLSGSDDLQRSRWGWRQVLVHAHDPEQATRAWRELRDIEWLRAQRQQFIGSIPGPGRSWTPWSDADWQAWSESMQAGDGERASLKRWLAAHNLPTTAPADFEVERP